MTQPIHVTILSGFLGAGKTTLLRHILNADHGYKIAVIENVFGEVPIDDALIGERASTITTLSNGCICCTRANELADALLDLVDGIDKGALPGEKSLRVVPNTNHNGILKYVERTLITFVNRFLKNKPLPQLTATLKDDALSVTFSEKPVTVKRWTANNPEARDFRYACDVHYLGTTVTLPSNGPVNLALNSQHTGWQATFVEATFKDGFVATSRVYVTPDDVSPTVAPPVNGNFCKTLPGRGLGETVP